MKKINWMVALLFTIMVVVVRVLMGLSFSIQGKEILCFPYELIGRGLRTISLQGGIWNLLALFLYVAVSLLPLALFVNKAIRKKARPEDTLLLLLTAGLFYVLYVMINPAFLPQFGNSVKMDGIWSKYFLSVMLHSLLLAYITITAIRAFENSQTKRLYFYMTGLLWACILLFAVSVAGQGFDETLVKMRQVAENNRGSESGLHMTYYFMIIGFLVNSLPKIAGIWIAFVGMELIGEMKAESYSQAATLQAKRLAFSCKISLIAVVISGVLWNGGQLLFANWLRNININVEVPLFWIVFTLGALIFSRVIIETRALKEENDSII